MISVIIPTFNEEEVIVSCLESLSKQSIKDIEMILIDDGGSDRTVVRGKETQKRLRLKNVICLNQKHKGPGAARNLGVKMAHGKILVFVDADMTFDKMFVEKLVEPIVGRKAKGTFSKEEYVSNWDNIWARCWNINEGWAEKRRHRANYPNHQKVFRAILKSEFDAIGGFTPGGYNDDWSLSQKLGYEAQEAPGAIFYHRNPQTLTEIFFHARWVSKRNYKLGIFGSFIALIRVTLPFSIIVGFIKSIRNKAPLFVVFKVVYDFGAFCGIITTFLNGNLSK